MGESRPASSVSELLEMVEAEWQRLLQAIDGVGEDRLEEPLLHGGWSARDVLSHVRLYEAWLLGMLRRTDHENQAPYRSFLTPPEALHERNRMHVEWDRRLAPDEARRRALETHAALHEVLAGIPDGRLSVLHTVDEEGFSPALDGRPLAWLIAVETYWHYSDHTAALKARVCIATAILRASARRRCSAERNAVPVEE